MKMRILLALPRLCSPLVAHAFDVADYQVIDLSHSYGGKPCIGQHRQVHSKKKNW